MRSGELINVDLCQDAPDRLGAALVAGDLDIGPISLVDYLHHAEQLLLLPDLAVGSDGPVLSVNLVSTRPPSALDGARVALGATSRTGVLLARLLLAERYGVHPRYHVWPPPSDDPLNRGATAASGQSDAAVAPQLRGEGLLGGEGVAEGVDELAEMLRDAEAAVLIGDEALRAHHEAPRRGLTVVDLGQAWREWTGLPMVFAVWAARRQFAADHPGLVKDVHEAFLRSREWCLAELDEVATAAARWEPFDAVTLASYFRRLDFSLGARQVAGLREFARRAAAAGAAPELPGDGPRFAFS
jgi:chorismate dehydratase